MTVYPFSPATDRSAASQPNHFRGLADERSLIASLSDDEHDDVHCDEGVDDSLRRSGGPDLSNRLAHRVVSPPLLSSLTECSLFDCQALHHVLFSLLESVGSGDGLIATPTVVIGRPGVPDRAAAWLEAHPLIDARMTIEQVDELETNEECWQRIDAAIASHSLDLARAVGTDPSLTFGSVGALTEQLVDDNLDVTISCVPAEITSRTRAALWLLARLPGSTAIAGGAVRRPGDDTTTELITCLTRDTLQEWWT